MQKAPTGANEATIARREPPGFSRPCSPSCARCAWEGGFASDVVFSR